jgi:heme/copper-type cytochrome/quinol oxidase subunit 2
MKTQCKIAILLTLLSSMGVAISTGDAALADEKGDRAKTVEQTFEAASKDALELLRRDAAKARPDWVVVVTASAAQWNFNLIYTRGKGLAVPSPSEGDRAQRNAVPPLTDLVLPQNASVELNITSNDGIRALDVSGLGIKADAIPGRIARASIDMTKLGVFSSTCAEPCSAQAKSGTLTIHIVDSITFRHWLVARDAASASTTRK